MIDKLAIAKLILTHLYHDRTVLAGTSTSSLSLSGSYGITHSPPLNAQMATVDLAPIQQWIALFAGIFGGLAALATFVYVIFKIIRLARNPRALE